MIHILRRDSMHRHRLPRADGHTCSENQPQSTQLVGQYLPSRSWNQETSCSVQPMYLRFFFFHGMELSVLTLKVAGPLYLFPPIICICIYLNLFLNFFIPYLKMLGTFLSPYFHKFNLLPHLSRYSFKIGLRPSGRIFYHVMHKFMF